MNRRGIALAYVLLLSAVLTAFLAALFIRNSHTLHLATVTQEKVRADQLAQAGLELTFVLMRDVDPRWYLFGAGPNASGEYPEPNPITNEDPYFAGKFGAYGGGDLSTESLGGSFTIEILDPETSDFEFGEALPDEGTYKLIVCTGRSGKTTSRAMGYVKVTHPIVNFLMVTPTATIGPDTNLDGPAYVTGDTRIIHAHPDPNDPNAPYGGADVRLSGELHATGDIFVENPGSPGPVQLDGEMKQGTTLAQPGYPNQLSFTPRDFWADPHASFSVRTPSMAELIDHYRSELGEPNDPDNEIQIQVPPEGLLVEFGVDGAYDKVTFSNVAYREVGRLFDRAIYLDSFGVEDSPPVAYDPNAVYNPATNAYYNYGHAHDGNFLWGVGWKLYNSNPMGQLIDELIWDDPEFPNDTYPPALIDPLPAGHAAHRDAAAFVWNPDLDGDGVVDSQGDYMPIYRIVRGPNQETRTVTTGNNGKWFFIRLVPAPTPLGSTSAVNVPVVDLGNPPSNFSTMVSTLDPNPLPEGGAFRGSGYPIQDPAAVRESFPPVYIRGVLDGKVVLMYDADDGNDPLTEDLPADPGSAALDPWTSYPKVHTYVLAQHEMPEDRPTGAAPTIDQLVPGGVHYADADIKTDPDDTSGHTDDALIVLSKGTFGAAGTHGHFYSWLTRNGIRYNYRKALRDLEEQFAARFPTREDDFRIVRNTTTFETRHAVATFYGVGVSNWCVNSVFRPTLDQPGSLIFQKHPSFKHSWDNYTMAQMAPGVPTPPGVSNPIIGALMRSTRCEEAWDWRIRGSLHSLGTPVGLAGDIKFDYAFQELTDDQIEEQVQLPLGPILLHRMSRK